MKKSTKIAIITAVAVGAAAGAAYATYDYYDRERMATETLNSHYGGYVDHIVGQITDAPTESIEPAESIEPTES